MPNVDRKWLPLALIGGAVMASFAVYGRLPAIMDVRLDGLLPVDVSGTADRVPRWLALSLVPALAFLLWGAFRAAPTAGGQRVARRLFRRAPEAVTSPEQFERFGKSYDAIVLGVVILLLGLHAAIIAAALGQPEIALRIVPAVLGASLILMGNVMPRLRPNWVAGIRTKRTLEDPQLWRSTHRAFGTAFVLSGVLTMLVGVAAPRYGLLTFVASLLVSCIVGFVASTRPALASSR